MKFVIVNVIVTVLIVVFNLSEILCFIFPEKDQSSHIVSKKDLNYANDDVNDKYGDETINFGIPTDIEITPVVDWPNNRLKFGQVSGVSLDISGNVYVFHRDNRVWNLNTFLRNNTFAEIDLGPISKPTVAIIHPKTGELIYEWGKHMFYLPHGITVDSENNVWITDVAMHQVFKFSPLMKSQSNNKIPILTLGSKFIPGSSKSLFCKPTAVAVLPSGEFFVSDGYCNSRIIKFASDGTVLLAWGRSTLTSVPVAAPEYHFSIPHDLTIVEDKNLICVADRENGRIQCFHIRNGSFIFQLQSPEIGSRIFSASYTPANGGLFFIVNGFQYSDSVHGSVVEFNWDKFNVIKKFQPPNSHFNFPHDVIVSRNGSEMYVAELDPQRIWKFQIGSTYQNALHISDLKYNGLPKLDQIENKIYDSSSGTTVLMAIFITAVIICFAVVLLAAAVIYFRTRTHGRSLLLDDLIYDKKDIYQ